jgi:hypothetical protein
MGIEGEKRRGGQERRREERSGEDKDGRIREEFGV